MQKSLFENDANILPYSGEVYYYPCFFSNTESDLYFQQLLHEVNWKQKPIKIFGKEVMEPRLTAWFGDKNGNDWTPELLMIKEKVEAACENTFDGVLLNYYRDGNDSVAWHSDNLPTSGRHHAIASVTFGETRMFKVRPKSDKNFKPIEIPLTHGSFLLMGDTMQEHYEHHVPKTTRKIGPRINLTFRKS